MSTPRILASNKALQTIVEQSFLRQQLLGNQSISVESTDMSPHDSLVVFIENGSLSLSILNSLLSKRNRVILVHMGDEFGEHFDPDVYNRCAAVIRNYFFSTIFDDASLANKVIWFPNGHRDGVGPCTNELLRPASQRRRLAMFSGWLKNDRAAGNERRDFKRAAELATPLISVHETAGFAAGFSPPLYASLMEHSVFSPCPGGNNYETIRLYDSLELGCIPIVTRHVYLEDRRVFPIPPPFPVIDSWSELPSLAKDLSIIRDAHPNVLDDLQLQCITWWSSVKKDVRLILPSLLSRLSD